MQNTTEVIQTHSYTLRPMSEADIAPLVEFFNELERLEPVDDGVSLGEFTDWYRSPMNKAIYILAHLAEGTAAEGPIIGVAEFTHHPDSEKVWGWLSVHPTYRLRGVGRALYNEFDRRARQAGAASLHVTPNQQSNLLIEFLERRDFTLDRYFWSMRLPADHPVEPSTLPEGITVRTFVPGQDEPLWVEVRNATFAEHYGSVPRTLEEITHASKEEHFRPDGLFFAFDGDQIAGFCLTGIDPREAERLGYSVGHIHTIGTMPTHRRRGIGRGLLLTGVNYLRRHVTIVELGVEGKNASALTLYESVGFQHYKAWANMVKSLGE